MWLLTQDEGGPSGDIFKGKKMWLRPGKTYLFGRTMREPGQIVIQDPHVSRKHLTIEVANVPEGEGTNPHNRAKVTVHDLDTKIGSWVNDKSIAGERFDLIKDDNEIKLGKQGTVFRVKWHPVIFSFSFTKAEIEQGDALATVRQALEPLDIKYVTDGRPTGFTHLVSKKRNSSKVMQALINCQLVVSQAFTDAVVRAAVPNPTDNGLETSLLEGDFEGNWPDASKFVPAGPEGVDEAFAPNKRRRDIFDGYTFIFYDKRYETLLPVITAGKGKALLSEVVPGKTDVNDFIRYVKSVAGEKGLGEFEDGSEGRGVVVVRYTPPGDGEEETWYKQFFNEFALRLDHRPIEIRELLFAVLDLDPAQLRRPLQVEPTPRESATQYQGQPSPPAADQPTSAMGIDNRPQNQVIKDSPPPPSPPPVRKARTRRAAAQSRFKSFDVGSADSDEDEATATTQPPAAAAAAESQGMFMTQQSDIADTATTTQRKRPADVNVMDLVAPNAARTKRQRIERGEAPVPTPAARTPTPEPEPSAPAPTAAKKSRATTGKGKKKNADSGDELDAMIERGQEQEAARRAADELLRRQLEGGEIDFSEIREATVTQTMPIRRRQQRQQQQPGAEGDDGEEEQGRWSERWNGLTNFKKFRPQQRGDEDLTRTRPRGPPRRIVSVVPVRAKEYGISDEYWLQDGGGTKKNKKTKEGRSTQTQTQTLRAKAPVVIRDDEAEESDDDDDASLPDIVDAAPVPAPMPEPQARSRKGKAAERQVTQTQAAQSQSQSQTTTRQTRTKRAAAAAAAEVEGPPAKKRATTRGGKQKAAPVVMMGADDDEDSEEDEDGAIGFRFGKRK